MGRKKVDVPKVLEDAADLIETVGLAQGMWFATFEGQETGYCAVGAIRKALGQDDLYVQGYGEMRVVGALRSRLKLIDASTIGRGQLINWSDAPERTAAEVADTFKLAAKDLRNQA